jgi:hypothetical protein
MTVEDYVSTPADNYKFMVNMNAPKPQPAAAEASAPAAKAPALTPPAVKTPASSPQPPKP